VIAQSTPRRLMGGLFEYEDLGAIEGLHGAGPGLARESAAESRLEALHATAALTPLVGRKEEVELLLRRWARAEGGDVWRFLGRV
jgi:hypothetical protein